MWRAARRAHAAAAACGAAPRRRAVTSVCAAVRRFASDSKAPAGNSRSGPKASPAPAGAADTTTASASGATSAAAANLRQQMLARFGKDRQQPQPQRFQSAGVSASESLAAGLADASGEPDYGVSRKGLLKNAKPFYQIHPAPAHVRKSPRSPLLDDLYYSIKVKGPMTVSEYMAMCLGHPLKGYYMSADHAGRIFGRSGDFVTNPDISQLFSEMLCVWVVSVWEQLGKPKRLHLVELGPGRGTMMRDILAASQWFQEFGIGLRVHLVENSPILREAQYWSLIDPNGAKAHQPTTAHRPGGKGAAAQRRPKPHLDVNKRSGAVQTQTPNGTAVEWHWHIGTLPSDAPIVVLAHEFFDALPVHQFQYTPRGWCERMVDIDNESGPHHLRLVLSPGPSIASWHYMMKHDTDSPFTPLPLAQLATASIDAAVAAANAPTDSSSGANVPFVPKPSQSSLSGAIASRFESSTAALQSAAASLFGGASASSGSADATKGAAPQQPAIDAASQAPLLPTGAEAKSEAEYEKLEREMVARLMAQQPVAGDSVEVGAAGMAVMEELTLRIAAQGGAALVIDYGADHPHPMTLQGVKQHARAHILAEPGNVDLSAHVNFNALRRTALAAAPRATDPAAARAAADNAKDAIRAAAAVTASAVLTGSTSPTEAPGKFPLSAGDTRPQSAAQQQQLHSAMPSRHTVSAVASHPLATAPVPAEPTAQALQSGLNPHVPVRVFPVVTQREFLREMGIQERLRFLLSKAKSDREYDTILSGFNRLVGADDSTSMGALFKVMAVAHTSVGVPYGFHMAVDPQGAAQHQPPAASTAAAGPKP